MAYAAVVTDALTEVTKDRKKLLYAISEERL